MRAPFSTAVAIALGLVVLSGYFFQIDVLTNLRAALLEWAVVLAAIALLVGIANLFYVHWRKYMDGKPGSFYSAVLLVSLIITLGIVGWFGPTHPYSLWLFDTIQVPVESSLMAILSVLLVYAVARLLKWRRDLTSIIFILTVVFVLLSTAPIFGILNLPGLSDFRAWITQVPAVGGARGILLGVVLGIVATSLRILTGADRPYRG